MAGDADPLPLAAGTTMDQADLQLQKKLNAFVETSLHNSKIKAMPAKWGCVCC
jgi:hypothetical protein